MIQFYSVGRIDTASYIKKRDATGRFRKPVLIEIFDTRSRYMFALDAFFSESSRNALFLFTNFLLISEFPMQTITFRPDGAGGFKNLKRVIKELNLKYSTPGGFFMKPDFARPGKAKDKPHLESSHRALHNFEARVIKHYEDRIVKYGYKKVNATVSKNRTLVYGKREYYVASGAENFGRAKSTPVSISCSQSGRLFIFERKADGIFLGEALPRKPFRMPAEPASEESRTEKIARFLQSKGMVVDLKQIIKRLEKGLTLKIALRVLQANKAGFWNL